MSRDYRQEYLDFHASRKAKDRRSELMGRMVIMIRKM